QRIVWSVFVPVSAAAIASYIAAVSAFFLSGRFIRTMRMPPSSLMSTRLVMSGGLARQRCVDHRASGFGHRRFEAAVLHGDVLCEEARGGDAVGAVAAGQAKRGQRLVGEQRAPRCMAEHPQIRRG